MPGWPRENNTIPNQNNQLTPAQQAPAEPIQKTPDSSQKKQSKTQEAISNPTLTSTYQTEVNHVIKGTGAADRSMKKKLRNITLLILFLILSTALFGGWYLMNTHYSSIRLILASP